MNDVKFVAIFFPNYIDDRQGSRENGAHWILRISLRRKIVRNYRKFTDIRKARGDAYDIG